jgi:hypothetical protein
MSCLGHLTNRTVSVKVSLHERHIATSNAILWRETVLGIQEKCLIKANSGAVFTTIHFLCNL